MQVGTTVTILQQLISNPTFLSIFVGICVCRIFVLNKSEASYSQLPIASNKLTLIDNKLTLIVFKELPSKQ